MTVRLFDNVFEIDLEATKKHERDLLPCECPRCTFYRENVGKLFPEVTEILEKFGVDSSSPDEVMSYEEDGAIVYYEVEYSADGKIVEMSRDRCELSTEGLSVGFGNDSSVPGRDDDAIVRISVFGIKMPCSWAESIKTTLIKEPHKREPLKRLAEWLKYRKNGNKHE